MVGWRFAGRESFVLSTPTGGWVGASGARCTEMGEGYYTSSPPFMIAGSVGRFRGLVSFLGVGLLQVRFAALGGFFHMARCGPLFFLEDTYPLLTTPRWSTVDD